MVNQAWIRSLIAGLAALVCYGTWAWYANLGHGPNIALRSGLVQGGYSLILTFLMSLFTEHLYGQFKGRQHQILITTSVVSFVLLATAYTIHRLAQTPEILMTITPGYLIGTAYTLVYVLGLRTADQLRQKSTEISR